MKKIRILWCTDSPCVETGFGRVSSQLILRLLKTGRYEIHVMGTNDLGEPHPLRGHPDLHIYPLVDIMQDPYGVRKFPELLRRVNPDLVFALNDIWVWTGDEKHPGMDHWMFRAIKEFKPFIPCVIYFAVDGRPWEQRWIDAINMSTRSVVFTKYGMKVLKETPGVDMSKVRLIYHGAAIDKFFPLPKEEVSLFRKQAWGIESDEVFVVGCVARNQPRKNIPRLLHVFKCFSDGYGICRTCKLVMPLGVFPDCEVCGDTEFSEINPGVGQHNTMLYLHMNMMDMRGFRLPKIANDIKLTNIIAPANHNVAVGIPIEELNKVYNAMDVHVLPTYAGGFELPQVEAQAAGTPTVGTRTTCMTEHLDEGKGFPVLPDGFVNLDDANHCEIKGYEVMLKGYINTKVEDVKLGDEILTHKGRFRKINHIFKRNINENVTEITLRNCGNAEKMMLTGNHPVSVVKNIKNPWDVYEYRHKINKYGTSLLSEKGVNLKWAKITELEIGDYLMVPRLKKSENFISSIKLPIDQTNLYRSAKKFPDTISINKDLMRFLAYFVAEGCTDENQVKFSFGPKEFELAQDCQSIIERIFGLNAKTNIRKNGKGREYLCVSVGSRNLVKILNEWCGKLSHNKKLPEFVFDMTDDLIIQLITSLIKCDGTQSVSENSKKLLYNTVSRTLAYQLKHLYINLGYIPSLYSHSQGKHKDKCDRKTMYAIHINGKEYDRFASNFGEIKGEIVDLESKNKYSLIDDDFVYYKISDIKEVPYEGEVYNFEVEEDNTYCTSLFLVHNCLKHPISFKGLLDTLNELYYDKEKRQSVVPKALEYAKTMNWDTPAKQFDELFQEALQERIVVTEQFKEPEEVRKLLLINNTIDPGNLLSMTPVFRSIKKKFSPCELVLACNKNAVSIIENNKNIDKIVDCDKLWFEGELKNANIQDVSHAIPHFVQNSARFSSLSWEEVWLNAFRLQSDNLKMDIFLNHEDKKFAKDITNSDKRKKICICVDSSNPTLSLSNEKWGELINLLSKFDDVQTLVLNNDDIRFNKTNNVIFIGKNKVRKLAACIDLCDLIVTLDNAFLLIAKALNKKIMLIQGPRDASHKLGNYKNYEIISMKEFFDTTHGCMPCWINPGEKCMVSNSNFAACLVNINPVEIFGRILQSINEMESVEVA